MPQGIQFDLLASKYQIGDMVYEKPFTIQLPEDHGFAIQLRNTGVFKETPVFIDDHKVITDEVKSESVITEGDGTSIDVLDLTGFKTAAIEALKAAGFGTIERILSDDVQFEELTAVHGIREATANKLIEACEAYVAKITEESAKINN